MRIAFLSHQWPGARMGGIGSAVRQTAAAMASAGHDVHVFTLDLPADVRGNLPAGVRVHETPNLAQRVQAGTLPPELSAAVNAGGEGIYRLATGWLLCAELLARHAEQAFDIVEAPEVEALGLPLMMRPDVRLPVVTHLHCCTAIAHMGNNAPVGPDEHLIRALEFAAIALADGRCAPTQRVVEITADFMAIDDDVAIIPHPAPVSPAEPAPPVSADRPADAPILFFGRIEHLKGVETLAAALNQFLPRNPDATFRFVGPDTNTAPGRGSMVEHLKGIIHPNLLPRIAFPGEADRAQMAAELAACRFCVLPSLWENFSMACCEAMAAGRAVIVGAGTGSVEVVGDAGLIAARSDAADLAEQMERLYRDSHLCDSLAARGRTRIETRFAASTVARLRADYYAQVIARAAGRPEDALSQRIGRLPPDAQAALLRAVVMLTGILSRSTAPRSPGSRLLAIMNGVQRTTGAPASIVLFGAGKHSARLLSERALWERQGHRVVGIIDEHPRFQADPHFLDLPVRSIGAAATESNHPPIVLSTDTYEDAFWLKTEPLRSRGVKVFRLYGDR